jgi:hypothetical protein
MSSNWTGGRRRLKPVKKPRKKTLVVKDPSFFAKRDKKGNLTSMEEPEWSTDMIEQAAEKWEQVLIFIYGGRRATEKLNKVIESLSLSNIINYTHPSENVEHITAFWKECLIKHGAEIKRARNPREITYLNIDKFVTAPHFTWVEGDDHKTAGIVVDKPKSFNDLQKERRKRSQW